MIYRPVPVTEAKAGVIDEQLRRHILAERTTGLDEGKNLVRDPGLFPAQGKLVAIQRRIAALTAKREKLIKLLPQDEQTEVLEGRLTTITTYTAEQEQL